LHKQKYLLAFNLAQVFESHNTTSTNAAWLVAVVQCMLNAWSHQVQYDILATIHSLQRLHESGTV